MGALAPVMAAEDRFAGAFELTFAATAVDEEGCAVLDKGAQIVNYDRLQMVLSGLELFQFGVSEGGSF